VSKRDKEGAANGFRGKLMQEGQVVFAKVSGAIESDSVSSGQSPRSGYFQIPPDLPLHCGRTYELELDNGQFLTIALTALVPPGQPAVARFVEALS
jgi:hypothetical protein